MLDESDVNVFNDSTLPGKFGKSGTTDIEVLFVQALKVLLFIGGVAAIIFILLGAYGYVTAGGDSEKAAKARLTIIYAAIGLILIILSTFIFRATNNLFTASPDSLQVNLP